MDKHVLVWLRHDLRLQNNPVLLQAQAIGGKISLCYFGSPNAWNKYQTSPRQVDLLARRLAFLQTESHRLCLPLFVITLDHLTDHLALVEWCQQQNVTHVITQEEYTWAEQKRDVALRALFEKSGIDFQLLPSATILPVGSVLNQQGEMYRVFSAFRKAWWARFLRQPKMTNIAECPTPLQQTHFHQTTTSLSFDGWQREKTFLPVSDEALLAHWQGFLEEKIVHYGVDRDFPSLDATSGLSAYFAIGAISPQSCVQAILEAYPEAISTDFKTGAGVWLSQMIWREFYYHLLAAFPALSCDRPFLAWTDKVQWQKLDEKAVAWQEGKTGFPLIDAAMRQLRATGWMHNRLRMLVASFWCKDLRFDWRVGEKWFQRQLIDGDFALNNGGWQWSASTGTDATPYFRIFNPTTQSERFDPNGDFIRQWVPELASVPNRYIHAPHCWSQFDDLDYPMPIVDHRDARQKTLAAYQNAKN